MAEGARKAGADAIACIPPYFFQPTDQAIVDHYRTVAGAADLPLFVYNLPMCTHVAMTPPLMENLIDGVPQLAGMKHSDFNMYYLNRFIDMDLAVYTGMMGFFLAALALGCCGGIDGPPNVAPEPFVEAYDSYLKGDLERAEKAQRRASRITNLIWTTSFATAFHSAYKTWMTARLGIDCGKPRPPLPELSGDQKKDFLRRMKELGGL
jgi:4-hydroxy-tetrahydrodipicolinate synthase